MKIMKFRTLLEVDDENWNKFKPRIGDLFLSGRNIISQKDRAKVGNNITFFKVIGIKKNGIEYIPITEKLEE